MSRRKRQMRQGDQAGLYRRVSEETQVPGYSLDAQQREGERWCHQHGYVVAEVYTDAGISGRSDQIEKRPAFKRLLDDADQGKLDIVVVHTTDRFARNVGVQRSALQRLGEAGVGFASVVDGVDFTTPSGKLLLTTMGGVAEFFSDQLAAHVEKAQRQRVAMGLAVGPLPFGYERTGPKAPPVPVEGEARAVQELFHRRAEGHSNGEIAQWLNECGFQTRKGNRFTSHAVKDMLNNRFYLGFVKYLGEEHPGQHEAIVPEDLFQRVQARKQRRQSVRTIHGPKGLLQGRAACAQCGAGLQSDRHRQQVPLYRERHAGKCLTNNTSLVADVVDRQVAAIVHSLDLRPDWRDRMAKQACREYDGPSVADLQEKKRRLARAYGDGAYSDSEYQRRVAELDRQMVQAQGTKIPGLEEAAELFANIPQLWEEATVEERRKLLSPLIEKVYVDLAQKRVVGITPVPAFEGLLKAAIHAAPGAPVRLIPSQEAEMQPHNDHSLELVETGESRTPRPERFPVRHLQA